MISNNNIERRYFVKIRFYADSRYSTLADVVYFKDDMTLQFFVRWQWYFKYREALLRVQNPHAFIELSHGGYEYTLPKDLYKSKLYNLLVAAKRKKTEFQNKINFVRDNWNELFPMEDHPKWKTVQDKLNYYDKRVHDLNSEYKLLINNE